MAVSLFWQFQVKDFDSWLNPDPDGLAQMFKQQGVAAYSLHRSAQDPNAVMVQMQFADESGLNSFDAWYKEAKPQWEKQHAGSQHEIVASWIGTEVPGYTRTL